MSTCAVDTSVLLAIFKGEFQGVAWLECLHTTAERGALLVSSVVVAEVRSFFPSDAACLEALQGLDLHHSPLTEEAALLAGEIFCAYRLEGGPRKMILPDFLVAAHAARQADALATEDRGYLRRYFPAIRLLTPRPAP
ncbi:MAG TPA: type II toxin-antitoxin system VapC family toxin [Chthoniobacterales bacterium]